MSVLVKVDEDLPEDVATVFASAGYLPATVRGQGWSGVSDDELWKRIQTERRWLVTADKGFGDIRKFAPSPEAGILLIRAEEESRRRYVELAPHVIRSLKLEDVVGCLVVATPRGIRIRRVSRPP